MVVWTEKMKNELLYTKNPTLISKKYKMAYETARRQLLKMLDAKGLKEAKGEQTKEKVLPVKSKEKKVAEKKEEEKVIKEIVKELEKEQTTEPVIKETKEYQEEIFNNIKKVIIDIEGLTKKGIEFYLTDSRKQISEYDKVISDYRHILEDSFDTLSETDLIDISKNIGMIGRKRRLFKNEDEFIVNNKVEVRGFLDFIKKINIQASKINNKLYNTRILKEDIGHVIVTSKHNDIIKSLESENQELKEKLNKIENNNAAPNNISEDVKTRLFNLEKYNLKEQRRKDREKGKIVAIDFLVPNWKERFNTELDDITRNGIISDSYAKYTGLDIKEIRDLEVWGKIIPEYLYEKKYFTK